MGIIIVLLTTWFLRISAVQEKWHIRNEIADTPKEKVYAGADGANLAFEGGIIAPFQAIVSVIFWGIICWAARVVTKLQKMYLLTFP